MSERFLDEKQKPIPFEIRAITNAEDDDLRAECVKRVALPKNQYRNETNYPQYLGKLAALATVFPNLNDKELQDSYGVMGADVLLKTMLTPGELSRYIVKVQEHSGFDTPFDELVDEVKN